MLYRWIIKKTTSVVVSFLGTTGSFHKHSESKLGLGDFLIA